MSEEPESCPKCNNHPSWEEIYDGAFQCTTCQTIVNSEGVMIEEGEEPMDYGDGDKLYDE